MTTTRVTPDRHAPHLRSIRRAQALEAEAARLLAEATRHYETAEAFRLANRVTRALHVLEAREL